MNNVYCDKVQRVFAGVSLIVVGVVGCFDGRNRAGDGAHAGLVV